jgi:exosome complex RNA-binding protein Rrp4
MGRKMDNKNPTDEVPQISQEDRAVMSELGITRTLTSQFHIGDYRYSTLDEAVAEAERQIRVKSKQYKKLRSKVAGQKI